MSEVELLRERVYASLEAYCRQKYPEQQGRYANSFSTTLCNFCSKLPVLHAKLQANVTKTCWHMQKQVFKKNKYDSKRKESFCTKGFEAGRKSNTLATCCMSLVVVSKWTLHCSSQSTEENKQTKTVVSSNMDSK